MNRTTLVIVAIVLFSEHVNGMPLPALINKNVQDAAGAYERTLTVAQAQKPIYPAQLWIHVRTDSQKKIAQEILDRVVKAEAAQWKIEQEPIQKVDSGPRKSQLRYFKRQDQTQAKELFDVLHRFIPQLELINSSDQWEKVGWIKPGYYELWLSPNLKRLQPQQ